MLEGRFGPADTVVVDCEAGEIAITKQETLELAEQRVDSTQRTKHRRAPETPGPFCVSMPGPQLRVQRTVVEGSPSGLKFR